MLSILFSRIENTKLKLSKMKESMYGSQINKFKY